MFTRFNISYMGIKLDLGTQWGGVPGSQVNFNYFIMKLVELANFNETFLGVSCDGDYIYVRLKIKEIFYIATTCV